MEQRVLDRISSRSSLDELGGLGRFLRKRQNIRILLYAMLMLCDIVAIRAAFGVGLSLTGGRWLGPPGFDLGWVILPIHIMLALRGGAYSHEAVKSRLESAGRACRAFMLATAIVCMLIFFERAGILFSRRAVGISIVLSLFFITMIRAVAQTIFIGKDKSWMYGELLIIDGATVPSGYSGDVVDAQRMGIFPDIRNPAQLSTLAELVQPYDRVVVSCAAEEQRGDWAQMMKCYQVTGEVLLDGGSPMGAIAVDRFRGYDTVVVSRGSMSVTNRIKKRAMDIIVSAVALVFLSPLLLLVSLAIKFDSKGPVFFAQPRMGRNNRMFRIIKFRSMRVESSDIDGNRSATRDDDRITRVGRVIRATSIDELPQFINVLLGEMSIVGPRPHALGSLAGDKHFWEVDTGYWRRHALKPGITGLAQVRGFRGPTHEQIDLENRLQSDLEYISGWSLWRDFKILISTVRVIVHPRAY